MKFCNWYNSQATRVNLKGENARVVNIYPLSQILELLTRGYQLAAVYYLKFSILKPT